MLNIRRKAVLYGIAIIAIIAGVAELYRHNKLTLETLQAMATAVPSSIFIAAFLLLPLCGFPISALLVASGLKFGLTGSIALAVFGMLFHTLAAWWLTHGVLREPLQRRLAARGFKLPMIPARHQIWFTSLLVFLPGMPYSVELYGLALTNLPFRRYAPIVCFFHVLNAIPVLGVSASVAVFDSKWLMIFGVLAIALIAIGNWLRRSLSRRFGTTAKHQPINECLIKMSR